MTFVSKLRQAFVCITGRCPTDSIPRLEIHKPTNNAARDASGFAGKRQSAVPSYLLDLHDDL